MRTLRSLPLALAFLAACEPEPFQVDFRVWPTDLLARDDVPYLTGGQPSVDMPKLLQDGRFPALDRLSGFGVTGAITVNFTDVVDVADLLRRHRGLDVEAGDLPNGGLPSNPALAPRRFDFRDDAIFVLNVDRACERYGEEVLLDFGRGLFPTTRACAAGRCPTGDVANGAVFPGDPDAAANDLVHEWRDEDVNANGLLDEGEDLDGDGGLDRPYLLFSTAELDAVADHPLAAVRTNPCLALEGTAAQDRCVVDHTAPFVDGEGRTLVLRPAWPLEPGCMHAVLVTDRVRDLDGRPATSPLPFPYDPDQASTVAEASRFLVKYGLRASSIAFSWTFTTARVTAPVQTLRDGLYGEGRVEFVRTAVPEDLRVERVGGPPIEVGGGLSASGRCVERAFAGQAWLDTLSEEEACALSADWKHVSHVASGTFSTLSPIANVLGLDGQLFDQDVATERVGWTCVVPKALKNSCKSNPDVPEPGCAPFPVVLYVHDLGGSRVDLFQEAGRLAAFGLATCGIDAPAHGYGGDRDVLRRAFSGSGVGTLAFQVTSGRAPDVDGDGLADSGVEFLSPDPFVLRDRLLQWTFDHLVFLRELRRHDGLRKELPGRTALLGDFDRDGTPDLGGRNVRYTALGVGWGANVATILGAAEPVLDGVVAVSPVAGITDTILRSHDPLVRERLLRPLVEPNEAGTHTPRNDRDFRDLMRRWQHVLDPVDAAAWAPHVQRFSLLASSYDKWHGRDGEPKGPPEPGAALLVLPSVGDPLAPPDAGLRLALAAGLLGDTAPTGDLSVDRGGREVLGPPATRLTQSQWGYALADGAREILALPEAYLSVFAAEGLTRLDRFRTATGLADVDDYAPGDATFAHPIEAPRTELSRRVDGVTQRSGLRFIPHVAPDRTPHGLPPSDPRLSFDVPSRTRHLVGRWLATLDPSRPPLPHVDPSPDLVPTSRDTKHQLDDRTCAACETTRPVTGCSLSPCLLDTTCLDLGVTRVGPEDVPWSPGCE